MSRFQVLTDAVRERFAQGLGEGLDGAVLDVSLLEALTDPSECARGLARLGSGGGSAEGSAEALSRVVLVFCQGFLLGQAHPTDGAALEVALAEVPHALRGFAYEGAATGLAILDYHEPTETSRLGAFAHGVGARHRALVAIGAGVTPVFRRTYSAVLAALDPDVRWFAVDGFAYREAFLYRRRTLVDQKVPGWLEPRALRPFDHGVGRGIWFVFGGEVNRIEALIASFPEARRVDLWSGVGFASTYTGAGSDAALAALACGPGLPGLRAGAALAAWARVSGGCVTEQTVATCEAIWGRTPEALAAEVEAALANTDAAFPPAPLLSVT